MRRVFRRVSQIRRPITQQLNYYVHIMCINRISPNLLPINKYPGVRTRPQKQKTKIQGGSFHSVAWNGGVLTSFLSRLMNVMTMCRHLIVGMAAAVSLVALPTSGFAPSILPKIVTPLPLANNPQSLFDRKAILNSGAAASAIDTQRSLSGVQSKIVRALMITFIAAMCVALPV